MSFIMNVRWLNEIPRIYVFSIPLFVSAAILTTVLLIISQDDFPSDNARYAYSAIFQGFAAILALTVTAILITLQNMRQQRFLIEERIYKILGHRYSTYIPNTIQQIKREIKTKVFVQRFHVYVQSSTSGLTPAQQDLLVNRVINELKRKFKFLDDQEKHEPKLRRIFVISVGLIVLIMIYSLTALIIVVPEDFPRANWVIQSIEQTWDDSQKNIVTDVNGTIINGSDLELRISSPYIKMVNTNNPLGINPFHILYVGAMLVLVTLEVFAFFFIEIIKTWKLSPE